MLIQPYDSKSTEYPYLSASNPEANLRSAILTRAVRDAIGEDGAHGHYELDALEFIMDDTQRSCVGLFTFVQLCESLDLKPATVRGWVLKKIELKKRKNQCL